MSQSPWPPILKLDPSTLPVMELLGAMQKQLAFLSSVSKDLQDIGPSIKNLQSGSAREISLRIQTSELLVKTIYMTLSISPVVGVTCPGCNTIQCLCNTSLMLAYLKGWISCPRCTVVPMFTGKTKGRNGMSAFLRNNTGDTMERTR